SCYFLYLLAFVLLFFSQSYSSHRALHPFPTRRSSDLLGIEDVRRHEGGVLVLLEQCAAVGKHHRVVVDVDDSPLWIESLYDLVRSEEHTSELQSRFDLVCRLLLEKKNKNA